MLEMSLGGDDDEQIADPDLSGDELAENLNKQFFKSSHERTNQHPVYYGH